MKAAATLLLGLALAAPRGAAEARPFLKTGLPIFANDLAARRHYRLRSLIVSSQGTVLAAVQLRWGPDDLAPQQLVCRRSEGVPFLDKGRYATSSRRAWRAWPAAPTTG